MKLIMLKWYCLQNSAHVSTVIVYFEGASNLDMKTNLHSCTSRQISTINIFSAPMPRKLQFMQFFYSVTSNKL